MRTEQVGRELSGQTVNKIILKCANWVGDTIITTPTIRVVRQSYPSARITAIARPWVATLLRTNPDIDEVWEEEKHGRWRSFKRLARRLRDGRFDLGIAFPNSFAAALLLWAGRVRRRVGYARDGRSFLLTDPVHVQPPLLRDHEVRYHFNLLSALGDVPETIPPLVLEEQSQAREAVNHLLETEGIAAGIPLIGINPGAFYGSSKRWPTNRFATVAQHLIKVTGGVVVLAGSKGEYSTAQGICNIVGERAHNLSGRASLTELVSLIRRMTIFVTNDSGPMHMAAALNVRTVAIFGPTDWIKTSPWSQNAIVIRRETACAPCMLRCCPIDHRCMERVLVADVLEGVRRRWPELGV